MRGTCGGILNTATPGQPGFFLWHHQHPPPPPARGNEEGREGNSAALAIESIHHGFTGGAFQCSPIVRKAVDLSRSQAGAFELAITFELSLVWL
jgi:hypothetical protein